MLKFLLILLVAVILNAGGGNAANPIEDMLRVANLAAPLMRDISNFLGKVNQTSFHSVLNFASNLVGAFFPQRHLPRVPERWWGDEDLQHDTKIRPFRVVFSDEMISDLRARIYNRRNITRALHGAGHTYGTNADYLSSFLDHWASGYDFKSREAWLNRFPQYVTNIQGLDIHFTHVRPLNPHRKKVLPLLLLHGWIVTGYEFVHVIELLLQEREECDFVFELIVPDLPGFGYSEGTSQIGLSQYQIAIIMKNLMRRLGKPHFYIHAGDIGQFVADSMAVLFPDRVLGLHTNFPFSIRPQTLVKYVLGQLYPSAVTEPRYQNRMYPLIDVARFYVENSGYLHLHASRPDNVGHGLEDSPVAQASWLIETLILITKPSDLLAIDGNLPKHYHMADIFDSFTVYWDAQCMVTSIRSYAEILAWFQDPLTVVILMTPTPVPFAAIRFRYELVYQPDSFLRDKYPNLVQASTLDFGGHFPAYEEPAVLADDIWKAVAKMEAFNAKIDVTEDLLV